MFELPGLSYTYDALAPHIDEKTMKIHHDKHHQGYVNKLNATLEGQKQLQQRSVRELLANISQVPQDIRQDVINNGGGHANHSFYWAVMSPNSSKPSQELEKALNKFGGLEQFKHKFTEAALGQFGSGWAWLSYDQTEGLQVHSTANQDSPLLNGKTPILGVDLWEHAYYLNYQNKRADYIKAWWQVVNWEQVEKNWQQAIDGE